MGAKDSDNKRRKLVFDDTGKDTVCDVADTPKPQSPKQPETEPSRAKLVGDAHAKPTVAGFVTPGQILAGRYTIVEQLGSGGMGMVYKATDGNLENRVCAIKVLPPDLARDEGAVKRLRREALAAIELHHSNIMAVNSFETDGEISFIVMEYLDGLNLDVALADKGKFTVDEVLDIARQICPALDFAHERGVIHRDIKPANLMYKTVGNKQVVKIADFGIAYLRLSTTLHPKITGQCRCKVLGRLWQPHTLLS